MQFIRAFSASVDSRATSVGPSMSKDGWGRLFAIRWSLTIVVFSIIWVASSRIRDALFILDNLADLAQERSTCWNTESRVLRPKIVVWAVK